MTILTGDCREEMPWHAPYDMILADPPYGDTSLAWDRCVEGWVALARAWQARGDADRARTACAEVLRRHPGTPAAAKAAVLQSADAG